LSGYSGDIVLAITGDKIDSGKITLLAERPQEELKQFKHVEAPKEINVAVLRSLFELLRLSPGVAFSGIEILNQKPQWGAIRSRLPDCGTNDTSLQSAAKCLAA